MNYDNNRRLMEYLNVMKELQKRNLSLEDTERSRNDKVLKRIIELKTFENVKKELSKLEEVYKKYCFRSIYSDFDFIMEMIKKGLSPDIIEHFFKQFNYPKDIEYLINCSGGLLTFAELLYNKNFKMFKLLLKYKLDINLEEVYQDREFNIFTLLCMIYASQIKSEEDEVLVLEFLIKNGIKINSQYKKGFIFKKKYDIGFEHYEPTDTEDVDRNMMDYIISNHINCKLKGAFYDGYLKLLKYIFELHYPKVNINIINKETIEAIVDHDGLDILELFISYYKVETFSNSQFYKDFKIISELHNKNQMVDYIEDKLKNKKEMYISNILSHPSNSNNKALNQLLKEIDLHRTYPPDYLMPLFYLIKYNNINGIKMLAEIKDFNKNETDETGETALMYAIKNFSNNEKLIEQLLSSGVVNINGFNHEDINPLIYAIKQNNIDLIKLLLKYNPKINIENQKKVSPVKIAVIEKKIEILKLLINNTKKNKD